MPTTSGPPVGTVSVTVPDALLTLLRWCLLALLYLFFFRVMQATWFGSLAPAGKRAAARSAKAARVAVPVATVTAGAEPARDVIAQELVVIEPVEFAGRSYRVDSELTIGRAAGCELTLDDTYISQLHARLYVTESGVVVEDLGSTNGTYLNRQRVSAPVVARVGDQVQVGSTVLELR